MDEREPFGGALTPPLPHKIRPDFQQKIQKRQNKALNGEMGPIFDCEFNTPLFCGCNIAATDTQQDFCSLHSFWTH